MAAASSNPSVCKDLSAEMAAGYSPKEVEAQWAQWWEAKGYFHPRSDTQGDKAQEQGKFVITLPPPNVTGRLHLGHALTSAVQDTICRFQRMDGKDVLYVPGSDHAGIATQVVVEKRIQREEGKSRHDLGREKFLERVWEHKKDNATFIHDQLQLLGTSCDWSRDRFTMDEQCAAAVTEAFVQLHEGGKVYRATRLVNWCCALQSAISDLEVEFEEVAPKSRTTVPGYDRMVDMGQLTHFAYKVDGDEAGAELVVATTRPETILGDTAIAVHPDDERYKRFHGKFVKCPFRDEVIPIVCDGTLVDMAFGTGVVKVTPAHDPNDFECGKRNRLPAMSVFDLKGFISCPGEFLGMHRFAARWHVVEALKAKNLLRDVEAHANRVPRCTRTKDIIEPMIMPQWFVDCGEMAKMSLEAVDKGDLVLTPDYHKTTWKYFLENIKPWCVSRQIWWGHRIPAYVVKVDGQPAPIPEGAAEDANWVVARNLDEARAKARKQLPNLTDAQLAAAEFDQDPDVLDTWFSSGLWPFSTMGWPNKSSDMARFFPGTLLETGHDILFFWVARMVMLSLHFFKQVPFKEVFLHAMVRDKDGQKMSKSKGNVIDPIDVMYGIELQALHDKLKGSNLDPKEHERAIKYQKGAFPKGIPECGSDALRFGLLSYTQSGRNVNLDIERIVGYRQFCNKLWNVTRFILYHALDKDFKPDATLLSPANRESYPLECRWILSRLDAAAELCAQGMTPGTYDFHQATSSAYHFWLYELCDVFLELCKPVMADSTDGPRKKLTQNVLVHVVEMGLRLLHPMMPFVTEELYHRLPQHAALPDESIMMAPYPRPAGWRDASAEEDMRIVNEIVHALRSIKGQYTLTNKVQPDCWIAFGDAKLQAALAPQASLIKALSVVGNVSVISKADEADAAGILPLGCAFSLALTDVGCHMNIRDYIDPAKEVAKLAKQIDVLDKSKQGLVKRMQLPDYEAKVPADVRAQNDQKLKQLDTEIQAATDAKTKMELLQKEKEGK
jgi:valyl-tRNA synthetase